MRILQIHLIGKLASMALKYSLKAQGNEQTKTKYIAVPYQELCQRAKPNALRHRLLMLFAEKQDILVLLSR